MLISKIMGAISSKKHPFGELYKESPNGIKIFKKVKNDGTVILSSFDGEKPFKTITKHQVRGIAAGKQVITAETTGHETEVINHKTGMASIIKVLKKEFFEDAAHLFDGHIRKNMVKNDVIMEHSAYNTRNGKMAGKGHCFIDSPVYSLKRNVEFDNNGTLTGLEIHSFERLG